MHLDNMTKAVFLKSQITFDHLFLDITEYFLKYNSMTDNELTTFIKKAL
jgi:hypothetical protein